MAYAHGYAYAYGGMNDAGSGSGSGGGSGGGGSGNEGNYEAGYNSYWAEASVVDSFATVLPEPTVFTYKEKKYTATRSGETITISDCPCTLTTVCFIFLLLPCFDPLVASSGTEMLILCVFLDV